jgi:hypothetical protein
MLVQVAVDVQAKSLFNQEMAPGTKNEYWQQFVNEAKEELDLPDGSSCGEGLWEFDLSKSFLAFLRLTNLCERKRLQRQLTYRLKFWTEKSQWIDVRPEAK